MKITKSALKVGSIVSHTSIYGMGGASGRVIAEAGTRYGRRYLWVNYTVKRTGVTYNSAFWDQALVPSNKKVVVRPPTTENTSHNLWS